MGDGWGPARSDYGRRSERASVVDHGRRLRAGRARRWLRLPGRGGPGVTARAASQSLQMHLVQGSGTEALQITVAPTIAAGPASQAPLPIRIGPPDALPKNSFVRVRGLPPTVSLSEGYVTAPGAWSVPIHALADPADDRARRALRVAPSSASAW